MDFNEELLYYIWRYSYFDFNQLTTTAGETIKVKETGFRNTNAGPDFIQSKIQLGSTLWVGNVEMHLLSSDWNTHRHQYDQAYNNVILHVVWEDDGPVYHTSGTILPCLELKHIVDAALIRQYQYLMHSDKWIPCQETLPQVSLLIKESWLHRLMAERLESRAISILDTLKTLNEDWESVCFQKLARALGNQVNSDAMEMLARITPLSILGKHQDQLFQMEALLFGQSGLLNEVNNTEDEYVSALREEYDFLQLKYNLHPMKASQWKFLRLRPANFPTLRIAQFARMIYQTHHLFSKFIAAANANEIIHALDIKVSQYWKDHYTFGALSTPKEKRLGKQSILHIIINTVSPLLFAYGVYVDDNTYKDKAVRHLTELPAEKNHITSGWAALGWKADQALHSQAMIQLKNNYCNEKRCLQCSIGHQIIKLRN